MPLYETVVIGRCGKSAGSANLLRAIAIAIMKQGGNVRDMSILGDRIMARNVRGKDEKRHVVGRYMQVLFDGNTISKKAAEEAIEQSFETLNYRTHLMKDYFSEAQLYKKSVKQMSLIQEEEHRDRDYVAELTKILRENEEKGTSKENVSKLATSDLDRKVWRHN